MASVGSEEGGEAVSLNIMPMLDIFSILVTFLLMSFSTDPINHDLRDGVELPKSVTIEGLDEVPQIAATPTALYLNDDLITQIIDGDIPLKDRSQGAIPELYRRLVDLHKINTKLREAKGKKEKVGTLTLEMHQKHVFKLIKRIMLTAQQAEFATFKLAVKKNS